MFARLLHLLFHSWETAWCTTVTSYQQCRVCGKRRIRQQSGGGYQPVDWSWLRKEE